MYRVILFFYLFLISCESPNNNIPSKQKVKTVNADTVSQFIKNYINTQLTDDGAAFYFLNDTLDIQLKFKNIHQIHNPLKTVNHFSVCVDMVNNNGDLYDIDFFLKQENDSIRFVSTQLHKFDDQPQYIWKKAKNETWQQIPIGAASKKLMNVVEDKDQFTFHYDVTVPELTENAEMWIPIVQTNLFQTVQVMAQDVPIKHDLIKDKQYNNEALYLKLRPEDSGKKIELSYKIIRKEKMPYVDADSDPSNYLKETPLLPVGGKFTKIDEKIFKDAGATTDLEKARAIYSYIIDHMRYTKQVKHGTGDAYYACDMLSGNCTEFHSYFITLARTANIPARFFIGASIPSLKDSGEIGGYHCWVEFYADGKWWPLDISEAFKYSPLRSYFFGHNPANRILFSQGREIDFNPVPNCGPINFFAYPILEINGEPKKAETHFYFKRE